jgi:hypothetical protein
MHSRLISVRSKTKTNHISRLIAALLLLSFGSGTALAESKIPAKPVEPFYRAVSTEENIPYVPEITYLSPEKKAPIEFSSLGASWRQEMPVGTAVNLEVRLKSKGKYSDWYHLEAAIDDKFESDDLNTVSSFLTTNLADGYQYRVALHSEDQLQTPVFENLKFTFINGGTPQQRTTLIKSTALTAQASTLVAQAESPVVLSPEVKRTIRVPSRSVKNIVTPAASQLKIISRTDWGADESLRIFNPDTQKDAKLVTLEDDYYTKFASELKESRRVETDEKGNKLTWPLSYPEGGIKKIIIHHTATTKNLDDPMKAIRDIYVWHTLSKGWGDIGYNYIIDQQGNIYEGRFGGETVVGAHAGRGNHGSIGIAVLGNFQDEDPPEAVVTALTSLVREKAGLYNIDTEGAGLFRGEAYPNVMGHRDIMSTSCPGQKLYDLIPLIRKLAKVKTTTSTGLSGSSDYDFSWSKNSAPVITILPKSKKMAVLTLKNSGKKSWPAGTFFQVRDTKSAQIFLKNSREILTGTVGREVKPGETAEIKVLLNSTVSTGSALIDLQPRVNGQTLDKYLSFGIQVKSAEPKKKYDYDVISVIYSKNEFKKGEIVGVTVKLRNKGTSPWQNSGNNKLTLGADKPRDHKNTLLETPSSRLGTLQEKLVQSGEIGTFYFNIKVPASDGIYREYFAPVVEGIQWMESTNAYLQIKVGNSDRLMTPDQEEAAASTGVSAVPGVSANSAASAAGATPTGSSTVNIAPTKLNTDSTPRQIRIDLAYRGNPAVISANGNFSVFQGATKLADLSADQQVNVKYENGVFKVTAKLKTYTVSARPRFVPSPGVIMRVDNWERRNTWGDKANNNEFRGVLEALIYNGELHLINELPLEDYLKGIAEESSEAPDEKIKSIMVISRTYARFYLDVAKKFPGAPFDLNDDPNYSQKYLGYSFEKRSPKTARLATETAGQYVTWQGKLVKTPYFSKSDGKRTIAAQTKWGWTDTPWLVSVDDSACVSGAFSGHGVGLSGCGATALAKQGKTYQDIIKYYYPGTAIIQTKY